MLLRLLVYMLVRDEASSTWWEDLSGLGFASGLQTLHPCWIRIPFLELLYVHLPLPSSLFSILYPTIFSPLANTSTVFPYSIIFWYCLWTLFIATLLIPKAVLCSLDLKFLFVRLFSPGEQQQRKFRSANDPSFPFYPEQCLAQAMDSIDSLSNKGTTGQAVNDIQPWVLEF